MQLGANRRKQSAAPAAVGVTIDGGTAPAADAASQPSRPLSTQLAEMPNSLETPDRAVEMLFVIESPRVVLFGNLLSDEECDLLISQSRDKLQRSSVVNASTGAYDVHPHRTSSGTYFKRGENELLQRIEKRIAELVDCPIEQGEPIQVLHYEPGGEYKPHYDYFDPSHPGNKEVLAQGGQTDCNVDHVFERRDARRLDRVSRDRTRRAAAQGARGVLRLLR